MTGREFLDFLSVAERLKSVPRHCYTADGVREDVASHCWRIALMAMLLERELPEVDMNRVIRMCIIHDLGEAITGDIPTFRKTDRDETVETNAIGRLLSMLPEPQRGDISALFSEMDAQRTAEARLYKALDKIEAVIQHNESDIATWLPLEYDLNRSYAHAETALFPYLKELRALILADTEQKIADGAERGITQEGAEKDYDRLQQLF